MMAGLNTDDLCYKTLPFRAISCRVCLRSLRARLGAYLKTIDNKYALLEKTLT
jgi:hypothetical protein